MFYVPQDGKMILLKQPDRSSAVERAAINANGVVRSEGQKDSVMNLSYGY